jgi:hypothetical protein
MFLLKLDVTKLEKKRFHRGEKGIYCDLVLIEKADNYGNDGFITQSISKEERDAGERGPIVGSWRELKRSAPNLPRTATKPKPPEPEDDTLPF